jgi:biotin carboxylase
MHDHPSVLILGGSKDQLPIIKLAKDLGYITIVADMNFQAPGLKIADKSVLCSTRDFVKVYQIAKRENVVGITSLITESSLYSMYYASKKLALPHYSRESVMASMSKIEMRKLFQLMGINDIPFADSRSVEEAKAFALKIGYPIIIKSSDTGGQVGLYKIENEQHMTQVFEVAKSQSLDGHLILEKFAQGPEINLVFTVYEGQIMDLVISDRLKDGDSFGIVKRHVYPSYCGQKIINDISKKCELLVHILKLDYAIVFPQMIIQQNGIPVFLELGVRVPGGMMNRLFECARGIDLTRYYLDVCLGKISPYEHYRTLPRYQTILVSFLNAKPGPLKLGRVHSLVGLEVLKGSPGIIEADYFLHQQGIPQVTPLKLGKDRFFYIISTGVTEKEAHKNFKKGVEAVDFRDSFGNTLIDESFHWDSYRLDCNFRS